MTNNNKSANNKETDDNINNKVYVVNYPSSDAMDVAGCGDASAVVAISGLAALTVFDICGFTVFGICFWNTANL